MEIAGKKVVDATKPLKIVITKRDVQNGDTKDPGACAAARAIMRQERCTKARVHLGRTYLMKEDKWVRYQTPKAIRTEIVAFDRGATFAPGEYTLTPVAPSAREAFRKKQGTGTDTGRSRHGKVKIARKKYHAVSGVRHGLLK